MIRALWLSAAMSFASLTSSLAHDYSVGSLRIDHPWSRATPGAAKVGAGYLRVTNTGAEPDRLLGGSTSLAERMELHQSTISNGIAAMRPLEGGLEIRPGETVELSPGGVHIMLVNLRQLLRQGDRFQATLTFEKAGTLAVDFVVQGMGAKPEEASHQHHGTRGGDK